MARIVKSVSLDAETDRIAGNLGNFSKWVRYWLIRHDNAIKAKAVGLLDHNAPRKIYSNTETVEVCYPFAASGTCVLCWPDGPPTEAGWLFWSREIKDGMIHAPKPEGEGWHEGTEIEPPDEPSAPKSQAISRWSRLKRWFKES